VSYIVTDHNAPTGGGAEQVPGPRAGLELPLRVVEGADLEEVEVVVEHVIGEVPAVLPNLTSG
jgi:hypothetical protein